MGLSVKVEAVASHDVSTFTFCLLQGCSGMISLAASLATSRGFFFSRAYASGDCIRESVRV